MGPLAYDDAGSGRPVLLVHGVCMSRRFFQHNVAPLAERFRVINVDLRGHGASPPSEGGHTVDGYARDLRHLIETLDLRDVVLVGWSMGTLVAWDYISQFGDDLRLAAHVNVSQPVSDLKSDAYPLGIFDNDSLHGFIAGAQADFRGAMEHFIPVMLKAEPSADELAWMTEETQKVGANAGCLILLSQSLVSYHDLVGTYELPTLMCFGADEKLVPLASAAFIRERQPSAELVVFDESGHIPMLEEPQRFNSVAGDWIAALPAS